MDDMLIKIRLLLGITNTDNDLILEWMLKDAIQAVLDYCHLKSLPKELETFVIGLVIRYFNAQNDGSIASIKRGDTTISYTDPITISDFTNKDKTRLNAYRRFIMR